MKHDFTVFVTNMGEVEFEFPFTTLVEKNDLCQYTPSVVRPQETVAVCFSGPETSHGTREKIEKWASGGSHVIAMVWDYCRCPYTEPVVDVDSSGGGQVGSMPMPGAPE